MNKTSKVFAKVLTMVLSASLLVASVPAAGYAAEEDLTGTFTEVTEEIAPEGAAQEEVAADAVIPDAEIPQTVVPEEAVPEAVASEEVIPETVVSEEVIPETVVSEVEISETVVPAEEETEASTSVEQIPETEASQAELPETAEAVSDESATGEESTESQTISTISTISLDLPRYVIQAGGFGVGPDNYNEDILLYSAASAADLDAFERALGTALQAVEPELSVRAYHISRGELEQSHFIENYLNRHPEFFYVQDATLDYDTATDQAVKITFIYKDGYTPDRSERLEIVVQSILSQIGSDWTDLQKAVFLHDFIVSNCTYDHSDNPGRYGMDAAILDHTAVCQGYATAYEYLMNRAGVVCEYVSSRQLNHGWNRVQIDGEYYYVDCTWDDPSYGTRENPIETYRLRVGRENFLRSREGITSTDHTSTDWTINGQNCYETATSSKYEDYDWAEPSWTNHRVKMGVGSGVLLFADKDSNHVDILHTDTGEIEKIEMPSYGCQGAAVVSGRLFFANAGRIYEIDEQRNIRLIKAVDDQTGTIYGIEEKDGRLYYDLGTGPYAADYLTTEYLDIDSSLPYVDSISLSENEISIRPGETFQLDVTVIGNNVGSRDITWSSDAEDCATVSQEGLVTGVSVGTVTITASCMGRTASCKVTVEIPLEKLVMSEQLSLHMGRSGSLYVTFVPENATVTNVVWTSSDESVVRVSSNGVLTPVSTGTAVVTLTCGKVSADCIVTVYPKVSSLDIVEDIVYINCGDTYTMHYTLSPSEADPGKVSWYFPYEGLTVDGNGTITAPNTLADEVTQGYYLYANEGGKSDSAIVYFSPRPTSISFYRSEITMIVGETDTLSYRRTPSGYGYSSAKWESSNPGVASAVNDPEYCEGTVTALAPGKSVITLEMSGCTTQCTVTVIQPVTGIVLNRQSMTLEANQSRALQATISPADATNKKVTWTSGNSAVANVDSTGTVTALKAGTAIITAASAENPEIKATCEVTVPEPPQPVTGIRLSKTNTSLKVGISETLSATVGPSNAANKAIAWTSNDEAIVTVNSSGKITAVKAGTAVITAAAKDGSGVTASCVVTVTQPVTDITLNKTEMTIPAGSIEILKAVVSPSDATNRTVSWSSSNSEVARLESSGLVIALKAGTAVITVSAQDGSQKKASCIVTVTQPVREISLDKSSAELAPGKTLQLKATVSPADATDKSVTWKSSNTAVAKVNSSGLVTAVANGNATITVTAADGSGAESNCLVTVAQPVTGITLNKTTMTLNAGSSETLKATVSPSNAANKSLTWTSSNSAVVKVDNAGKVTAVKAGSGIITAEAKDGSGVTRSCTVTVIQPVTGVSINKSETAIRVGGSETLTAIISPSDASNKRVSWSSSNMAVAKVDSSGKVTAVKIGTANITATAMDGTGKKGVCRVTVTKAPDKPVTGITLNKTETAIAVGFIEILKATVTPADATNKSLTWTSSNSAIATVDEAGNVKAVAPGTVTITAAAKDGSGKSAACKVIIVQLVSGVSLNKTEVTIQAGSSETLQATVSPANASNKKIRWTSSNSAVAKVDSTGKVTALRNGTATITATAADGTEQSASCEVIVNGEIPTNEMHRLYNPRSGEHFYTASTYERDILVGRGPWKYEGIAWHAPVESPYPVYRMYNPKSKAHHYTMDENERDTLCGMGSHAGKGKGWNYEGIGWYSAIDADGYNALSEEEKAQYKPLHRLYNPRYPMVSAHHYTADTNEVRVLTTQKRWVYEGIAWYGVNK